MYIYLLFISYYLLVYLFIYPFIYLLIYIFIYLLAYLLIYVNIYMYIFLFGIVDNDVKTQCSQCQQNLFSSFLSSALFASF